MVREILEECLQAELIEQLCMLRSDRDVYCVKGDLFNDSFRKAIVKDIVERQSTGPHHLGRVELCYVEGDYPTWIIKMYPREDPSA